MIDPPYAWPDYRSTRFRAPSMSLVTVSPESASLYGPVFGAGDVSPSDADLTGQGAGPPLGERIIVHGRVADTAGRPLAGALVEIWQANAAGRYAHSADQHDAPLDPNFAGAGRCLTGPEGEYRFVTIKPGEYPWQNHPNAWRPAHVHFSLFGRSFESRLVTQMYFPGDPLLAFDPMYQSIADRTSASRLIGRLDLEATAPGWALAYRFDVVLGRAGEAATPLEEAP